MRTLRPLSVMLLGALLVASLDGCAVNLMGRRVGLPARGEGPRETGLQRDLREARESATLAPAEPYWPFRIAQLYVGADSLSAAETALAQSLARDAGYPPALSLRSSLDYRAGRHERAIQSLETALARPGAFPDGPPAELLQGLALHYEAVGNLERADQVTAEAKHRSRRATPALVYLALRGDSPESAAQDAETVMRADPRSAANQNNYGITRLRAGDPMAARRAFERAVELDSTLAGPFYNLAILEKYYLFHDDAAANWFDAYWRRSQNDPDGLAAVFGKPARPSLAQD